MYIVRGMTNIAHMGPAALGCSKRVMTSGRMSRAQTIEAARTGATQTAHAARELWATIGPGGRWHPQAFLDRQVRDGDTRLQPDQRSLMRRSCSVVAQSCPAHCAVTCAVPVPNPSPTKPATLTPTQTSELSERNFDCNPNRGSRSRL